MDFLTKERKSACGHAMVEYPPEFQGMTEEGVCSHLGMCWCQDWGFNSLSRTKDRIGCRRSRHCPVSTRSRVKRVLEFHMHMQKINILERFSVYIIFCDSHSSTLRNLFTNRIWVRCWSHQLSNPPTLHYRFPMPRESAPQSASWRPSGWIFALSSPRTANEASHVPIISAYSVVFFDLSFGHRIDDSDVGVDNDVRYERIIDRSTETCIPSMSNIGESDTVDDIDGCIDAGYASKGLRTSHSPWIAKGVGRVGVDIETFASGSVGIEICNSSSISTAFIQEDERDVVKLFEFVLATKHTLRD